MSTLVKICTIFLFFSHVVCSAYTHTISNQTTRRIRVKFVYEGECQSNNRFSPLEINADTTRSFETACPLEQIVANTIVDEDDDTMLRMATKWRAPKGTFKGNGSWIVSELNDCHILNNLWMCKITIQKVK